jgi:SAM-dependent methyltransferase
VGGLVELTRVLKNAVMYAYEAGGRAYLTPALRHEEGEAFTSEISEGAFQYADALRALTDANAREVLDVGTGLVCWPRLLTDCGFRVTAIDKYSRGYWSDRRPFNRHYLVHQDDITNLQREGLFDALTCLHVMMAIVDHRAAIAGMFQHVRPGGVLVLSFPYNERHGVENVYALPEAGYGQGFGFPCRIYCQEDITGWLDEYPGECIAQERYRVFSGELWTMGQRIPPERAAADEPHHFTTVVIRKRKDAGV